MKASPILLQKKYARVVEAFAKEMGMTLNEALGIFYHSELYRLVSEGVSDMHCMSDAYLAEELAMEYKGIGEYAEKDCAVKGKTEKYLAHKEGEREQDCCNPCGRAD